MKIMCEHCGQMTRWVSTGETPAQKSARVRRLQRIERDNAQAAEMAALIKLGNTTVQAAAEMKIGVVRSQRVRAVAVAMGLLERRPKKLRRGEAAPEWLVRTEHA